MITFFTNAVFSLLGKCIFDFQLIKIKTIAMNFQFKVHDLETYLVGWGKEQSYIGLDLHNDGGLLENIAYTNPHTAK